MVWLLVRDRNRHSSGAEELCIALFLGVLLVWPAAPVIGRAQEPGGYPGMKHSVRKVGLPASGGRGGAAVLGLGTESLS